MPHVVSAKECLTYIKNSINNNGEVIISGSPRKSKSRDDVEEREQKTS